MAQVQDNIEVGDEVEILESVHSSLIGKKFRVSLKSNDPSFKSIYLDGPMGQKQYEIAKRKVKLSKKKSDFIMWSKPNIKGGHCIGCSKFSEYQDSDYTCYECKNEH